MSRFLPLLFLYALLLPAFNAEPLTAQLDRALAAVPFGGKAAVAVLDLDANAWLYQANLHEPLSLASTTKLFTAAAALIGLGADYEFSTKLVAMGAATATGALPGLGVIGGGTPCLDGHFTNDQPDRPFLAWAAALKAKGVTRIAGDVVLDNRAFIGPIRPGTYPQDQENQQRWYSAPASVFAWNDNCIEVRVLPTAPGQPAKVEVRPRSTRVQVRNLTRTVTGKDSRTIVSRDATSNTVTVSGNYGRPTAWFPLAIHDNPDLLAGDHLKAVLIDAGIAVDGEVRLGEVPDVPPLVDHRQALVPAVTLMNQHSQNFYAEQLLRLIGAKIGGEGSIASGCAAVKKVLTPVLGACADELTQLDGSGLSYGNQASALTLVTLLTAMHRSPLKSIYADSLKDRDVGKAHGQVKTGTHAQACCLAGYVRTASGRSLAFAVLLNRDDSRDIGWASKMREQLYRIIATGVP